MNDRDLIERASETNTGYLALGNESWQALGATFIRNRSTPRRHDANLVGLVRATTATAVDALLASADSAFEDFSHRMFVVDPLTPPALEARLAIEDSYRSEPYLVQLLQGDIAVESPGAEIREVHSEEDWSAYRGLDELWWRGSAASVDLFGPYDPGLHDEMMASKRAKSPMVRSWLAIAEGVPRAFLSSWPGVNGIGMVEDLYTHPDYRGRGLATALLKHCVLDARERGAGPVLIISAPGDTPKHMYSAYGFRPLYVMRTWTKGLA